MMSLAAFQAEHLPLVEAELLHFLTEQTSEKELLEAMSYSVKAGGKRIRPLFLLAVVVGFQHELTTGVYQTAAALEMIHTYSLIHDDLPAMDDDDLRRGKPTNHVVYGEGLAILAGDGLLTEAFHLLSRAQLNGEEKLLLLQLLAEKAGAKGMVAGQVADIKGEGQQLDLAALAGIHRRKTGDLLTFALVAGGILACQTPAVLTTLEVFSHHVGLAFQIRDDLLDVLATTEELGKTAGHDAEAGKNTYPALLGVTGAKAALDRELTGAKAQLAILTEEYNFAPELLQELLAKFEM